MGWSISFQLVVGGMAETEALCICIHDHATKLTNCRSVTAAVTPVAVAVAEISGKLAAKNLYISISSGLY